MKNKIIIVCSIIATLLLVSSVSAVPFFTDDFESGLGTWAINTTTGDTCVISTNKPYKGTHNLFASMDGSTYNSTWGGEYAMARRTLTSLTVVYARAYVAVISGLPLPNSSDRLNFIIFAGLNVAVGYTGKFQIRSLNSTTTTWNVVNTDVTVEEGKYYCLELAYIENSVGLEEGKLWIDGVQKADIFFDRASLTLGYVDFGVASTYGSYSGNIVTVATDNVVVSNSYIGPEPVDYNTLMYIGIPVTVVVISIVVVVYKKQKHIKK